MWRALRNHVAETVELFGAGWNRFWFAPSDPIVLSALRIAIGLIALYWQLSFTPDMAELFGQQGILPLAMLDAWQGDAAAVSYFDEQLPTSTLMALHFAGTAVLLLFTLGVFTRVTSVLALIVTLSYIHRAPMLTAQMEPILALVQFYLCLGPSGAALSIDAWRKRRGNPAATSNHPSELTPWATVAVRLLQVHLTAVYLMMALAKIASPAWWNGSAIWWLAARPESQGFALLPTLAPNLSLIEAWTHLVVIFELTFPLLVWNRWSRPLALLWSAPMWLLLALATGLNTFAVTMLAANLAFVSPTLLRQLLSRGGTLANAPQPSTRTSRELADTKVVARVQ